jgi:hypothetical protein
MKLRTDILGGVHLPTNALSYQLCMLYMTTHTTVCASAAVWKKSRIYRGLIE